LRWGGELYQNLATQKKAILFWDSSALLEQIEEKEALINRLSETEKNRQKIVSQILHTRGGENPSISEILAHLPPGKQTKRLSSLQSQARDLYRRLRIEDKRLVDLMEFILVQIRSALGPYASSQFSLYGNKGTLSPSRPESGLIQGKI